ncbi:hypothetical protein T492DRAFT_932704, partial [Pavlovales sp. CCMP2436]
MGNILVQAWVSSAPEHYRGDERSTLPFRANLRKIIRAVAEHPLETVLMFDGAKSEAKARTHSLRLNETRRADILLVAQGLDLGGKHHLADKEYRKLAYPVPDFVMDWCIHWALTRGRKYRLFVLVAPGEADPQVVILGLLRFSFPASYDGDEAGYGPPHFLQFKPARDKATGLPVVHYIEIHEVVLDQVVGKLDLTGWAIRDWQSVAVAEGTDLNPGVPRQGWAACVKLYNSCVDREVRQPAGTARRAFIAAMAQRAANAVARATAATPGGGAPA